MADPSLEQRLCPGCRQSAVNESGGLVVAFGQSFFHVDCFRCAKCTNQVTADTNLLLLSDGSPICADCSYNCNICHQPILDEAIMTGDDSYHAHCFKCKVCHNRIDELVFAKTSHGIYCMNCHNERMAKIRRHAQRKRDKEKAASASARDRDPKDLLPGNPPPQSLGPKSSALALRDAPSSQSLHVSVREVARKRRSVSPADPPSVAHSALPTPADTLPPSQSFVMTVAPPDTNHDHSRAQSPFDPDHQGDTSPTAGQSQSAPPHLSVSHLSPLPDADATTLRQRRKSYDDGVRPLHVLLARNGVAQDNKDVVDKAPMAALTVPTQTSRADKRRSINPGLTLNFKDIAPDSETIIPARPDSPLVLSASGACFDDSLAQRSSNGLLRDNSPDSSIYHSPSSSPAIPENDRAASDSVRARSASHDSQFAPATLRPTTPVRSAPRPTLTLERPPQRLDSLRRIDGSNSTNGHTTHAHLGSTRYLRTRSSKSELSSPMGMVSPTSPSHKADVPHGVESGTDTEAESSNGRKSEDDVNTPIDSPPLRPRKARPEGLKLDIDPDASAVSHLDGSDESSPVERTSIATFIAPALPPIRFSMSGSDFSDFLKSVGGVPSLRSLDEIAQQDDGPPKSPTSINTLIPQDDVGKPPSDSAGMVSGKQNTSSTFATPPPSADNDKEATDATPSFPSRSRAASESQAPSAQSIPKRQRLDSIASLSNPSLTTRITVTRPPGDSEPSPDANDTQDLVLRRLREALTDANARGSQQLRLDKVFAEAILLSLEQKHEECLELKEKYDRTKRASEQYIDGLTVAQKEYDRELVARRNAESEIIRLRVLLSGQAAKLTALTGETSRREARRQLSEELNQNLDRLEKDLSRLKAERDVTLAEVEELCSSKSASGNVSAGSDVSAAQLSRSLTMRLDNVKKQYQRELIPLTQQRDTLIREIVELRSAREQFLEETTVLNARNEELAKLSTQYTRRMEAAPEDVSPQADVPPVKQEPAVREKQSTSFDRGRPTVEILSPVQPSPNTVSNPSSSTLVDDRDIKVIRVPKPEFPEAMSTLKHGIFKWPGHRTRDQMLAFSDPKGKGVFEHNFQMANAIRFSRCDHCGEKMWGGSHFRCTICHINIHSRCVNQVHLACSQNPSRPRDELNGIPQAPSIFGRDLGEQVKSDLRWGERNVPVIVEKCIEAVDALALDYEGIYRKTGGAGQTKMISQLFDRGDYSAFDLRDTDRFNDIGSVTSVLKTYFRSLPVPLLTYDLHEEFIAAAGLKDPALKMKQLRELIDRLPPEHYHTLRFLVYHLHRVQEHSDANLMNARNLGVVFGPTLMCSRDPGSEFSDMAGKALMVEWLVENAPTIF